MKIIYIVAYILFGNKQYVKHTHKNMVQNYHLDNLPLRTEKPRNVGYTMVMDKGLSIRDAEGLVETSGEYIDIIKLGWATSYLYPKLEEKIRVYTSAGIPVYFGGTLFEAFVVRNQYEYYKKVLDKYKLEYVEVSDGSLDMPHEEKCRYISDLAKNFRVFSEVGSKDALKIIPPYKWIIQMQNELDAGSSKVIGEAREAGNVGIFRDSGEVRQGLVEEILTKIDMEKIIWEAPQKMQQVWFIKLLGANVNLGNIAPSEVIPLETIRLGIRSDTFSFFLNT
ncbi:MAG: phosphosulfolactate synthase [Chitinophagaceae bacterium]|nr:phosphosulfolactate synthase [Chitinophagaceae bacterium]